MLYCLSLGYKWRELIQVVSVHPELVYDTNILYSPVFIHLQFLWYGSLIFKKCTCILFCWIIRMEGGNIPLFWHIVYNFAQWHVWLGWSKRARKMQPNGNPNMNENDDYVTTICLEKGIFISNSCLNIGILKHTNNNEMEMNLKTWFIWLILIKEWKDTKVMENSECRTDHLLGCMKWESVGLKKDTRKKRTL